MPHWSKNSRPQPYIPAMTGDFSKLPRDLRNVLTSELAPGERVLYAAQPDWRAQWAQHLLVFTFGLGWMSICGPMAIFVWAETLGLRVPSVGAMGKGLAIFFSLLIIPFVVIGLACLVEPFSSARQSRRRVRHGRWPRRDSSPPARAAATASGRARASCSRRARAATRW